MQVLLQMASTIQFRAVHDIDAMFQKTSVREVDESVSFLKLKLNL